MQLDGSLNNEAAARIEARLAALKGRAGFFGEIYLHPNALGASIRMKDRIPFGCTACGAGLDGDWQMQPHNVYFSIGCPCCQSIAGVRAKFAEAAHLAGYQLSAASARSGRADVNSVRYTVTSPDGFSSRPLMKSAITAAIRLGRVPGFENIAPQRAVKQLLAEFKQAFPGGEIAFVAWSMEETTTPGPFFSVDTGTRVMREAVNSLAMPMRGVSGLVERELNDKRNHEAWLEEAQAHEATITGYTHTLGTQVKINYRSRTGYPKAHTLTRARETSWGQSGFKKGEKLCQAVFLELFPDGDWQWNKRYEFLRYGTSLLELDGYSAGLGLAFEHQGKQHYEPNNAFDETSEEFDERVKRDDFKKAQCAAAGIKLLSIPQQHLDPGEYLGYIQNELESLRVPFPHGVTPEQVGIRWTAICKNPLEALQSAVIFGLGVHTLVEPRLETVHATTVITYRCGSCGANNEAEARGFISGEPRRFCPRCKGMESGAARRARSLEQWKSELLPLVFSRLCARPGERIVLRCEAGHEEPVASVRDVNGWHDGDVYRCPHCETVAMGFESSDRESRLRAAVLNQHKSGFEAKLREAGLSLDGEIFMRDQGEVQEIYARVSCPVGHGFELGLKDLSKLFSNKYFSDRAVVPYFCETCAYGDSAPESRKGTIFHRLAFLKKFHPQVRYVGGFDPTGHAMETYHCGEDYKYVGKPHPAFQVRYATITNKDKAAAFRTPCYVCAVEKGAGLPSSSKTLEMIEGRMLLIGIAVSERTGGIVPKPKAALAEEYDLIDGSYISTSKTQLVLSCGVPGHAQVEMTSDQYFSVHKGGYCKACLRSAGVANVAELLKPS